MLPELVFAVFLIVGAAYLTAETILLTALVLATFMEARSGE